MKRAVCNELFGTLDPARSFRMIRDAGFSGVEIAPHTLFGDFSGNLGARTRQIRSILDGEGVVFAGLHWLLVGPPGLHITTADPAVRGRSWNHIRRLADIGGELGGGPMTLGSPSQRSTGGTIPPVEALRYLVDGLSSVAEHIAAAGCRLLLEALPKEVTDLVNTLLEARDVIDHVGREGIGGMFDFHNTGDEDEDWAALIGKHAGYLGHVHLNAPDGGVPAAADDAYRAAFGKFAEIGYSGWVSLEIFSVPGDPAAELRHTAEFLDAVTSEVS